MSDKVGYTSTTLPKIGDEVFWRKGDALYWNYGRVCGINGTMILFNDGWVSADDIEWKRDSEVKP